jgi:hypothetical protein
MVVQVLADPWKVMDHVDPDAAQQLSGPNPGPLQQVWTPDCTA